MKATFLKVLATGKAKLDLLLNVFKVMNVFIQDDERVYPCRSRHKTDSHASPIH